MEPQPFSQGNYELNEKCDNHYDGWCLFYWSVCLHWAWGVSLEKATIERLLHCTHHETHSSPKHEAT